MHITILAIPAALIASLGTISTAYAADCNQLAPTISNSDPDRYFEIQLEPITTTEQHQLADFAHRLSGKWLGTQSESVCIGHHGAPTNNDTRYRVQAEIAENFNGAIRLDAEKDSRRKVNLEKVFLSPITQHSSNLWQSGAVTFTDENSIIFSDKYKTRNGRVAYSTLHNSVRTVEEIKHVTLQDDNTLTIDRQTYINGHLVSQDAWALERH